MGDKNIWLTSDTHFCHDRAFVYEPRGFSCIADMNEAIVERWNSVLKPGDIVYHLGDVMLNDNDKGMEYLKKLNGEIHLLRGNHDTNSRISLYAAAPNVVSTGDYATVIKYGKYSFYLSHYPTLTSNFDEDALIKTRVINLCGHSHIRNRFKDMDKGLIYHVEIDCHNNFPISFDEILFDINHFISMDKSDQIDIIKKDIY